MLTIIVITTTTVEIATPEETNTETTNTVERTVTWANNDIVNYHTGFSTWDTLFPKYSNESNVLILILKWGTAAQNMNQRLQHCSLRSSDINFFIFYLLVINNCTLDNRKCSKNQRHSSRTLLSDEQKSS